MKRKSNVKYRAWLGFQAAKEKSRLKATQGKKKSYAGDIFCCPMLGCGLRFAFVSFYKWVS